MAKIQTLKERGTDVTLYPETSAEAVYFKDGSNAQQKVARLNEAISGKEGAFTLSDDLSMSEGRELSVTEKAKRKPLIDMWDRAWKIAGKVYGKYDPDNAPDPEHPFMGNGLWMTWDEALLILTYSYSANFQPAAYLNSQIRTNLPFFNGMFVFNAACWLSGSTKLELFSMESDASVLACSSLAWCFDSCIKLKRIVGIMIISECNAKITLVGAFKNCAALEYVKLKGLKADINIADSPLLSSESVSYMVANAANTSGITITVHSNVYAKLTGDTASDAYNDLTDEEKAQWTALIPQAAEKNITFVTT